MRERKNWKKISRDIPKEMAHCDLMIWPVNGGGGWRFSHRPSASGLDVLALRATASGNTRRGRTWLQKKKKKDQEKEIEFRGENDYLIVVWLKIWGFRVWRASSLSPLNHIKKLDASLASLLRLFGILWCDPMLQCWKGALWYFAVKAGFFMLATFCALFRWWAAYLPWLL